MHDQFWHPIPNILCSESALLGWGYLPWPSAGKQTQAEPFCSSLTALPQSHTQMGFSHLMLLMYFRIHILCLAAGLDGWRQTCGGTFWGNCKQQSVLSPSAKTHPPAMWYGLEGSHCSFSPGGARGSPPSICQINVVLELGLSIHVELPV